ncbi:DsrE family protein [Moorella naiadis]|uniref:DsrE/DsrF/TusD sulfur relay family protein n=1 Tax=Moorella naiadis (nom. illeg.) TaxID=3093670 RepID=UPI003D9CB275
MAKSLTLFLATTPYGFENTTTAIRLAETALAKGYKVTLFASGDGVHNFVRGQKAQGIPNAEDNFVPLIEKGLRVDLCGTCLRFRGIERGNLMDGAEPSTLKNLFTIVDEGDVFLSLGL